MIYKFFLPIFEISSLNGCLYLWGAYTRDTLICSVLLACVALADFYITDDSSAYGFCTIIFSAVKKAVLLP